MSSEEGRQKQTTASEFPAVQQATNDRQKRLVTAWCCFSMFLSVLGHDMERGAQISVYMGLGSMGVINEVWHFSSSNKSQRKFHGVQFNFHWRRLTKANHCIRISGCSASNQRPTTKKAGNGMVLFLSVLGFYMIAKSAKWTWIMNHGMTRVYYGLFIFWGVKFSLWIYSGVVWIYAEKHSTPWWRLLDACADSGCLCGTGFWQHYVWIYSCNLVSPADEPPSFPGTLSEIRDESFAGTFSRRHRWVFVGPSHLCVHGPPAFTLWFRVSHTQQAARARFPNQKMVRNQVCCFHGVVLWHGTWCSNVRDVALLASTETQGSFTAFNVQWRRLTKANHCIRISGCSASNQRPTKKVGNGMVLFLYVSLSARSWHGTWCSNLRVHGPWVHGCHEWGVAFF